MSDFNIIPQTTTSINYFGDIATDKKVCSLSLTKNESDFADSDGRTNLSYTEVDCATLEDDRVRITNINSNGTYYIKFNNLFFKKVRYKFRTELLETARCETEYLPGITIQVGSTYGGSDIGEYKILSNERPNYTSDDLLTNGRNTLKNTIYFDDSESGVYVTIKIDTHSSTDGFYVDMFQFESDTLPIYPIDNPSITVNSDNTITANLDGYVGIAYYPVKFQKDKFKHTLNLTVANVNLTSDDGYIRYGVTDSFNNLFTPLVESSKITEDGDYTISTPLDRTVDWYIYFEFYCASADLTKLTTDLVEIKYFSKANVDYLLTEFTERLREAHIGE